MCHRKAFFSGATTVAALLAGTVAMAGGGNGWRGATNVPTPAPPPPPMSCSTGDFDVRVSSGPTFVPCDAPGGQCTEIEYVVVTTGHDHKKKKPSHVFVLQGVGVWDVEPPGSQWYAPCEGIPGERDPGFGRSVCHEQAIKINTRRGVTNFKITLAGLRRPSPTSVAILTGDDHHGWKHDDDRVSACTILGLGLEAGPNPDQTTLRTETIDFKGCEVEFTRDAVTEEVVEARLLTSVSDSGLPCQSPTLDEENRIKPLLAAEVEVSLGRFNLGAGKFGEGYVSTGTESCTTRVIGGRVYTWGSPCP
jgi:hypothetical protein